MQSVTDKAVRAGHIDAAKKAVVEAIAELPEEDELKKVLPQKRFGDYLELYEAELMRAQVPDTGKREKRTVTLRQKKARPFTVEVGLSAALSRHGHQFTRGTTSSFPFPRSSIAGDAQRLDSIDPQTEKKYEQSYNFPGFWSVKRFFADAQTGAEEKSVTERW